MGWESASFFSEVLLFDRIVTRHYTATFYFFPKL